jgi:glycosyltransferase involved in cell wall biosynthesis
LSTSDSSVMADRMRALGAGEVMVFPFGLEQMPPPSATKEPWLFFTNRGLEPVYVPQRVLQVFAALDVPQARLVVANDGSLRRALEVLASELGIAGRVQFVGRLDATAQADWYAKAQWFVSLPNSDSVAVSVIEAMAHGCLPLLSDLPANRELVRDGDNGLIVGVGKGLDLERLQALAARGEAIAGSNRAWVQSHAMFAPSVAAFVERLRAIDPASFQA